MKRKTFKFVIPFFLLFKKTVGKQSLSRGSWRHSNAVINKSVWWVLHRSGKCGLMKWVGGRWAEGGGRRGSFGFPLMAATLHRRGKDPLKLVCRHRYYHSCRGHYHSQVLYILPLVGLVDPPLSMSVGSSCHYFKGGQAVESQIYCGEDKRVKGTVQLHNLALSLLKHSKQTCLNRLQFCCCKQKLHRNSSSIRPSICLSFYLSVSLSKESVCVSVV